MTRGTLFAVSSLLASTLACGGCTEPPRPGQSVGSKKAGAQPNAGAGSKTPKVEKKPFNRDTLKTPWKHAKVGDWALYKSYAGKEPSTLRFEVLKVEDRAVTASMTHVESGKLRNTQTFDLEKEDERYKDPRKLDGVEGTPAEQTQDYKGKELKVWAVKRAGAGRSTETWATQDTTLMPFNDTVGWAVVKSVRDGKLQLELLEFGSKKE